MLELAIAGLNSKPTVDVVLHDLALRDVTDQSFALPVWTDVDGMLRLALPKEKPQSATDCLVLIVPPADIIGAIAQALRGT